MYRLAAELDAASAELATAESRQAGKPIRLTTGFDVPGTIDNGAIQRLWIPSAAAAEQLDLAAVPPHADPTMLACGFFHVDCAVTLRRLYISSSSRSAPAMSMSQTVRGRCIRHPTF
jgi:hypothetical protein